LGLVIQWWANSTPRQKRLISGVIVCIVLIALGQTLLGISILLFDIVWEVLILLWRTLVLVGRAVFPIVLRILPNFIGSFITNRVIPFFANVIPLIRDDVKVMYMRTVIRERIREFKKNILKTGRRSRPTIRARISPLMPSYVREKKKVILEKTAANQRKDRDSH